MVNEQFTVISFYIVAHADDWQLFMQPNVYKDLVTPGSKVVFIITTAGDAGADETYWAAREEGLKSSLRFCLAPLAGLKESSGTKKFNFHTINYGLINNATCYFLRLPDGNQDGSGFQARNFHSLARLRSGAINTATALDDSAAYAGWTDLYTTLQTIISDESRGIPNVWVNYLNPDTGKNPNDHSDHIATGQAVQAMGAIPGLHHALFVGYSLSNALENLNGTDLFWKAGMFSAYEKTVFDRSGYSTLQENISTYLAWCLSSAKFTTANPTDCDTMPG